MPYAARRGPCRSPTAHTDTGQRACSPKSTYGKVASYTRRSETNSSSFSRTQNWSYLTTSPRTLCAPSRSQKLNPPRQCKRRTQGRGHLLHRRRLQRNSAQQMLGHPLILRHERGHVADRSLEAEYNESRPHRSLSDRTPTEFATEYAASRVLSAT